MAQDLNGWKQKEEHIRTLHWATEQSPSIITITDTSGNIEYVNPKFTQITGYSIEEVIGKNPRILKSGKQSQGVYRSLWNTIVAGYEWRCEFINKKKDGELYWEAASFSAVKDPEGNITHFLKVAEDITRQKKLEEELQKSKDSLEDIVKKSFDGILIVDMNGKVRYANHTAKILFNCSEVNLVSDIIDAPIAAGSESTELNVVDDKGIMKYLEMHVVAIEWKSEKNYLVMLHDVTHLKEQLRESKECFESIVDKSTDGILVVDENGIVRFVNPSAIALLGRKREYLIDSTLGLPMVAGKVTEIETVLEGGKEGFAEMRIAETIWRNKHAHLVLLRDVTEHLIMEREALKAQKLESIGVLAGGIAHDFNNMLAVIMGNINMTMISCKSDGKELERLTAAEKACLRARDLTQQLLTFSKSGAPIKKTTSIGELIKDSAGFVLRGSNVTAGFSISESLCPVDADEGQVNQVISNLVINARQAMPEGGTIEISIENIIVGAADGLAIEDGKYIRISVKDQGHGIPVENLNKIFDPYFTTKDMPTRKGQGLGLAICYSIIKNHGGTITVESKVDTGTTFYVYLPVSQNEIAAKKDAEVSEEEPVTEKGKILIMDDDDEVSEIASQVITHFGHKVEVARDGAEAIELYKKALDSGEPFDVAILDLTVPGGMGGKETIKKLLEIDPDVKAIVCSGYSDISTMADFKQHGFKGIVTKPFDMEKLHSELIRVMKGNRRRRAGDRRRRRRGD